MNWDVLRPPLDTTFSISVEIAINYGAFQKNSEIRILNKIKWMNFINIYDRHSIQISKIYPRNGIAKQMCPTVPFSNQHHACQSSMTLQMKPNTAIFTICIRSVKGAVEFLGFLIQSIEF